MSGNSSEFEIGPRAFERVRGILRAKAGIELGDNRQSLVVARLMRRVKALGFERFDPYLDLVERDEREGGQFVNALTTNVTDFFRERHHFTRLAQLAGEASKREPFTIRCWSPSGSREEGGSEGKLASTAARSSGVIASQTSCVGARGSAGSTS